MYKVYVKTDVTGRIISAKSDAFLSDANVWIPGVYGREEAK